MADTLSAPLGADEGAGAGAGAAQGADWREGWDEVERREEAARIRDAERFFSAAVALGQGAGAALVDARRRAR